jgi:hypothetical protein
MRENLVKRSGLLAESEFFDDVLVSLNIHFSQVVEQPPPLTDQLQKTSPGVMILFVGLEVLREVIDAIAQDSDLHLRGTCIFVVELETINDLLLNLWV